MQHCVLFEKKEKKKKCVGFKKKDEGVGTFYDGNSFCKIQSGWTSPGGPLDASERGTLSQYLAPRMLVKTRYQNIFFFHSYPYNLLIIHHLHLCFCIKDSKRKKESRSDCEKEERSGDENGLCQWFNKKSYKGRMQSEKEREAAKREKQLNELRWEYRQRDNE